MILKPCDRAVTWYHKSLIRLNLINVVAMTNWLSRAEAVTSQIEKVEIFLDYHWMQSSVFGLTEQENIKELAAVYLLLLPEDRSQY